jgi:hypothetical protein
MAFDSVIGDESTAAGAKWESREPLQVLVAASLLRNTGSPREALTRSALRRCDMAGRAAGRA